MKSKHAKILGLLKERFDSHMNRHPDTQWDQIEKVLSLDEKYLETIYQMEETGGEPDFVGNMDKSGFLNVIDCSKETPKERRSLCYDEAALKARKENKPKSSALAMAKEIGIEILTEEEYRQLQKIENFDEKTSSWIKTPEAIRKLGGAIFCDRRYDHVFTYHNGADSYYSARGFRGILKIKLK